MWIGCEPVEEGGGRRYLYRNEEKFLVEKSSDRDSSISIKTKVSTCGD